MSITGHSFSSRGRQQTQSSLSEQFPDNKIAPHTINRNADPANPRPANDPLIKPPEKFLLQQSLLKQSLPKKARLLNQASVVPSCGVDANPAADKRSPNEIRAQDVRPVTPPRRENVKTAERPNEVPRISAAHGLEYKPRSVKRPTLVVVHRRAFFRDCLVRCLEISYKTHEIFPFASISAWRDFADQNTLEPTVIVFFVERKDVSNILDLEFLEAAAVTTPVVVMSDVDDASNVVRALKGGARGYIPTSLPFNVAVEAVRLVEAGGIFVPVSSLQLHHSKIDGAKTHQILTERQLMVVEAIRQGKANKQIAYELCMSEHTVKVHLRHIMRKLNARNRTEVAVLSNDFL